MFAAAASALADAVRAPSTESLNHAHSFGGNGASNESSKIGNCVQSTRIENLANVTIDDCVSVCVAVRFIDSLNVPRVGIDSHGGQWVDENRSWNDHDINNSARSHQPNRRPSYSTSRPQSAVNGAGSRRPSTMSQSRQVINAGTRPSSGSLKRGESKMSRVGSANIPIGDLSSVALLAANPSLSSIGSGHHSNGSGGARNADRPMSPNTRARKVERVQHLLAMLDTVALQTDEHGKEAYPPWIAEEVKRLVSSLYQMLNEDNLDSGMQTI